MKRVSKMAAFYDEEHARVLRRPGIGGVACHEAFVE